MCGSALDGMPEPVSDDLDCDRLHRGAATVKRDVALRRGVAQRIVEQIGDALGRACLDPLRSGRAFCGAEQDQIDLQLPCARGRCACDRLRQSSLTSTVAQAQLELAALQPREIEQILDERDHTIGLSANVCEKLLARRSIDAALQRLDHELDRRERRAQFVRNVGDEFAAQGL